MARLGPWHHRYEIRCCGHDCSDGGDRRTGVPLKGDLLFAGTAGEEVDSMGAQRLVQQQKLSDVGFMVIGEPTTNRVFTAEKGVLWLELNTKGQTAHGSMPHLGVNAIMQMNKLLQALAAANIPYERHPLLGDFTMNVATITGGVKTNVVPDACWVTIDTRTVIGQDHQQILDIVRQLIDRLCAEDPTFQAEVRTITELCPWTFPLTTHRSRPSCVCATRSLDNLQCLRQPRMRLTVLCLSPPIMRRWLSVAPGCLKRHISPTST